MEIALEPLKKPRLEKPLTCIIVDIKSHLNRTRTEVLHLFHRLFHRKIGAKPRKFPRFVDNLVFAKKTKTAEIG
jgi:hypothetical protein